MLNENKEEILCVRGNCDAEVDQMVLQFPILADYMILYLDGRMVFATHGHIHNEENLPPLRKGDIILHGHTHVQAMDNCGGHIYLNPGSVSIPKEGNPPTYAILEKGIFTIRTFEDKTILEYALQKSGKDGDAEGSTV